jgi:hypothetical protein
MQETLNSKLLHYQKKKEEEEEKDLSRPIFILFSRYPF